MLFDTLYIFESRIGHIAEKRIIVRGIITKKQKISFGVIIDNQSLYNVMMEKSILQGPEKRLFFKDQKGGALC